jgi:ketosteroid isomerase-like protein
MAVVQKALDAIAAGELDAVMACLTDDVVFEFPYGDGGTVLDKAGACRTIGFIIKTFAQRSFEIVEVYEPAGSDRLLVEYRSQFRSAVGDVDYANRYMAVFTFRDGLISLWREYADPVAFEQALAAIKAAQRG